MAKYQNTRYTITAKEPGQPRKPFGRYTKKSAAKKELKKLLAPGKKRKITLYKNGKKVKKTIRLTSYRSAKSGVGYMQNPRIKKYKGY